MLVDASKRELKISLSAVEICDLFGNISKIHSANNRSRAVLYALLLRAMEVSDFKPSEKKLFIRVHPTVSGGCDILFVPARTKGNNEYIFEYHNCEAFLSACEQLCLCDRRSTCVSVYRKDLHYRMLVNKKSLCRTTARLLSEYAQKVYESILLSEKTKEHWVSVCNNTTVGEIALK